MGARAIWESSILQQPHHKSQPSPSPSPSHRNEQRTVYSALLNTFIDPGDSISISEFPSKLLRLRPFAISISEIHRSCIFSAARTGQDDISLPLLSTYTIHILPPLNCCRSQPIAIRSSRRAAHCRGDIDLFFSSKRYDFTFRRQNTITPPPLPLSYYIISSPSTSSRHQTLSNVIALPTFSI